MAQQNTELNETLSQKYALCRCSNKSSEYALFPVLRIPIYSGPIVKIDIIANIDFNCFLIVSEDWKI